MSTTTLDRSAGADTRLVLDRARTALSVRRQAEVEVLESVFEWAHAHPADAHADAAGWRGEGIPAPGSYAEAMFGERAIPIAGTGAPLVAEFCIQELAAALDLSHEATLALVGDVLDLAHRLPRLWGLVRSGRVPVHLGREAARASRDLDVDAAAHADRLLVWQPRRLNPHRVGVLVHEARLYSDPDRALADHDSALASRKVDVRLGPDVGAPGTGEVFMVLDEADAIAFDHTVSTMAGAIGTLGHPGSLDVRRAHAVGLLADSQAALDLLAGATSGPDSESACAAEDLAHERANPFRRPTTAHDETPVGEVELVFHVSDRDLLDDPQGVARSPRLGPVLVGRLRSWLLAAGSVTITPVVDLDPDAHPPVDQHDPPARMAAMVRHRDQTCVYPRCGQPAEACDLDHIGPYVPIDRGGPPGQTHPGNLAPLCRKHHRAKTFGRFSYRRLPDGSYRWTLPTGVTVTTDPRTPRPAPPPRKPLPHRRP
ncbi:HNH endonuclease [Nocardioides KLBMP 9356]|uniref:HNH endonuclease n=1 Tax=Nocardioides potassii TaxID=2911371 RepID=A0ABS9HIC8_9ACTN|nr:HNH endonuclease signature motif containing protein [Nocardioides potassii]MCF6380014.1 HNH endonuclease [Nocardioides potassii]